eukprot:scaffold3.g6250.t1
MPQEPPVLSRRDGEHNLYALLGLDITATPDQVRQAFRRLALALHPDRRKGDRDPSPFIAVKEAADVLTNPAARAAYDERILHSAAAPSFFSGLLKEVFMEDYLRRFVDLLCTVQGLDLPLSQGCLHARCRSSQELTLLLPPAPA